MFIRKLRTIIAATAAAVMLVGSASLHVIAAEAVSSVRTYSASDSKYIYADVSEIKAASEALSISAGYNSQLESVILEGWTSRKSVIDLSKVSRNYRTVEYVTNAYYDLFYTNPQIFYVIPQMSYSISLSGNIAALYVDYGINNTTLTDAQINTMCDKFYNVAFDILKDVQSDWSILDKLIHMHNEICLICVYDDTLSKYTAYEALVEGTAVCQGYALAYRYLLAMAGVSSEYVVSDSINHIWNSVEVDGQLYNIDVTWDDPSRSGVCDYSNFLVSDEEKLRICKYSYSSAIADWVTLMDEPVEPCESKLFEKYSWQLSTDALTYYNGLWYFVEDSFSEQNIIVLDLKADTPTRTEIFTLPEATWKYFNSDYYYTNSFSKVAVVYDRIYYSMPDAIYSVTLDGKDNRLEYTLEKSETAKGNCYDIYFNEETPDRIFYRYGEKYQSAVNEDYFEIELPVPELTTTVKLISSPMFVDNDTAAIADHEKAFVVSLETLDENNEVVSTEQIDITSELEFGEASPNSVFYENEGKINHFEPDVKYNGDNEAISAFFSNGGKLSFSIYRLGDANLDNTVNSSDSSAIMSYNYKYSLYLIVGGDEPLLCESGADAAFFAADINKDGLINESDASLTISFDFEASLLSITGNVPEKDASPQIWSKLLSN